MLRLISVIGGAQQLKITWNTPLVNERLSGLLTQEGNIHHEKRGFSESREGLVIGFVLVLVIWREFKGTRTLFWIGCC